jgi:hypothetical protein
MNLGSWTVSSQLVKKGTLAAYSEPFCIMHIVAKTQVMKTHTLIAQRPQVIDVSFDVRKVRL